MENNSCKNELELQKTIKNKLNELGHRCWQIDSGKKVTYKTKGQGLEKGFPDIFGVRKQDNQFFAIEVKFANGKPSIDQVKFLEVLDENKGLNGIAYNIQEALEIVEGKRTIKDYRGGIRK